MYKIPLTNSPNQTFSCTVPVNGENRDFIITLNYNQFAEYWVMTAEDQTNQEVLFSQLPMLTSYWDAANMIKQMEYKEMGSIYIVPIGEQQESMPNDQNIGIDYILVWSDNDI